MESLYILWNVIWNILSNSVTCQVVVVYSQKIVLQDVVSVLLLLC